MIHKRYTLAVTAFLVYAISLGYIFGFSQLLTVLIDTFKTTRAHASVIQSTLTAAFWCSCVIAGLVVQKYGAIPIGIFGSLAVAIPVSVSYFASSVFVLILSHAITGIGASCLAMSGIAVIGHGYEGKTMHLMLSLVQAGNGVGGMAYPYLLELLMKSYGLRGTFLVVGGLMMNALPLVLIWSSELSKTKVKDKSKIQSVASSNPIRQHVSPAAYRTSFAETLKTLFCTKSFLIFVFGSAITTTAQLIFLMFITDLMTDRLYEPSSTSFGIMLYNLAATFGRLVPGTLKQVKHCSTLTVPLLATVFGFVSGILITVRYDKFSSFISCFCGGMALGIIGVAMSNTSVTLVGRKNLAPGFGLALTLCGITILIYGPISGFIRDITESYASVYVSVTVAHGVGGIFFLTTLWIELSKRSSRSWWGKNFAVLRK